jgi:cell division transport system permease protein
VSRKEKPAASTPRLRHRQRPGVWIARHLQVALATLGELTRKPLASLMTTLVIAIALALPAILLLLLTQVETLSSGWQQTTAMSVFLGPEIGDEEALALAAEIEERHDVEAVNMLTRDDAMAEFRRYSGFGNVLEALDSNPLPAVLLVHPQTGIAPDALTVLVRALEDRPESELVQYDHQWLQRFQAMTAIGQRVAVVLGASLGLAVLLVVGNTIRLEIQNRRPEIEITKLVGGTDAFIRRPFLYRGIWYGLAGGIAAWLLTGAALSALSPPVAELAGLYGSGFQLTAWHPLALAILTGTGVMLGLGGAWVAVGRHLQAISPS